MLVSDIMTAKPVTIHQDKPLRLALEIMEKNNFHHLPVLNSEGQIVGILSDRDLRTALNSPFILRERWQDEELVNRLLARSVMTPAPIVVEPEADAEEAARLMLTHHISCLPVIRSETLVGIITTSDILMAFINATRRLHHIGEATS